MHMIGSIRIRSASTRKRSIRFGLRCGSPALATMTSRSTFATRICCRPLLIRLRMCFRGSMLLDQRIARRFRTDINDVARDHDVPQIGAQVLEQAADRETELPAIIGMHDTRQP